jgi:phenylacetyl-CoA:acceptor oxidoreductase subunit 2
VSYGPRPWQQQHWDFRAALNFMFGGAGAGLLAAAAVSGQTGGLLRVQILLGLALIGAGLTSVWFEIGRPLRAINVGFNPFTSWMTRESFVAALLFAVGLSAAWIGQGALIETCAFAALLFVYCQGRILRASKGIPAWREPAVVALIVTTGLVEGAGLSALILATGGVGSAAVTGMFVLALLARAFAWSVYRGRIAAAARGPALALLDAAGKPMIQLGTIAALLLLPVALVAPEFADAALLLSVAAALATGWRLKFVLITRAAYNQGFALPHLPVRGGR